MRSFGLLLVCLATVFGSRGLAATGPGDIPAYRHGIEALSGELWSVAATRFREALATPDLDPEARPTVLLRLAEALVRDRKPDEALRVLAEPALESVPERNFWTGQAQIERGHFIEALTAFSKLPEKSPLDREALLTRALVQAALGDLEGSVESFDRLGRERNAPVRALLLKAETLLDAGQPEKAIAALPQTDDLAPSAAKRAALLRGIALLDLGKATEAETIFLRLSQPAEAEGQSLRDFHLATIQLAKARLANGAIQAAADGLLAFIQQNPDSPVLNDAFSTLLRCLPAEPAPNDPILARLREWAPAPPEAPAGLLAEASNAAGSWPTAMPDTLGAEALYYLALATRRLAVPDAPLQARRLLVRLRKQYPDHPLVARSLLELGRWDLEAGRKEQAAAHFALLEKLGDHSPGELRAEGLALEARSNFEDGDFARAGELFDQAAALLDDDRGRVARHNAAVALLAAGQLEAFDQVSSKVDEPELASDLALERGIFLASKRDPEALATLKSFIALHPGHPRMAEAHLHAALAALDALPPDPDTARSQLAEIENDQRSSLPAATLALVEIRLAEASGDWTAAASRAATFLDNHPGDPERPTILYERGRSLFQNKDFNEAAVVLKTLVGKFPDHPDAPAALLLAARAAASGATDQSRKESIDLFQQLAGMDSPFRDFAKLELADLYILRSDLDHAIDLLEPWFEELDPKDPLLVDVGLKLGEALYARAQENQEYLEKALTVQDRLLSLLPKDAPSRQAIFYQKGLTLEQFGDRDDEALNAYMEVIEQASETPEGDWKAIEDCGRSALRILEKRGEWSAAMKLANRIAGLNGPNAAEALERAKTLRLQHYIYEE
ncbi:tetratricopeptide repeat protein [Haloferula sargassicola]|uniref:Cell division coordinator CpoB n=1 Tax=Haloferula sargassicola TaxID=490096 RepID=A0ABP9ULL3_9BACT